MQTSTKRLFRKSLNRASNVKGFARLVGVLEALEPQQGHLLHVLNYHRVDFEKRRPFLYSRVRVSPTAFEEQMQYLSARCSVVSMPQVIEAFRREARYHRARS